MKTGSVRRFVQQFYDWYLPRYIRASKHEGNVPPDVEAIKVRPALFGPELRKALLADWKAQESWNASGKDGIVGLDFDPFLYAQDTPSHYHVSKVEQKGDTWIVTLSEPASKKAQVVAVVTEVKGKTPWRFTNFLYGDGGDLVRTLRALRKGGGR